MEKTLVLVKPDAVERGLIGAIIGRFEARTFKIKALKIVRPSRELIERHYEVHRGKSFFDSVVDFMITGPIVAMVIEGDNAIPIVRRMMGSVRPEEALPGTIRGDLTLHVEANLVHGSDSTESAQREIPVWFSPDEILL